MNEIDQKLHIIRRDYLGKTIGSNWVYAPNEFIDMLRLLIARAKAIVTIRNRVAQGTFVLDGLDSGSCRFLPANDV